MAALSHLLGLSKKDEAVSTSDGNLLKFFSHVNKAEYYESISL